MSTYSGEVEEFDYGKELEQLKAEYEEKKKKEAEQIRLLGIR